MTKKPAYAGFLHEGGRLLDGMSGKTNGTSIAYITTVWMLGRIFDTAAVITQ